MESLRKLKDSFIGVEKSAHSRPYVIHIVGKLKDVAKDIPNDAELGEKMRKLIHTCTKHYKV